MAAAYWVMLPPKPVEILQFEVRHYDRTSGRAREVGSVALKDSQPVYFSDSVRILARFDRPTFPILYALDADGEAAQLWPADGVDDRASDAFEFPHGGQEVYTLNDGVGLQGFVLAAVDKRLDSDSDSTTFDADLWQRLSPEGTWLYDGQRFELVQPAQDRGEVETIAELPTPFRLACEKIQQKTGAVTVRAIAFPVLSSDELRK